MEVRLIDRSLPQVKLAVVTTAAAEWVTAEMVAVWLVVAKEEAAATVAGAMAVVPVAAVAKAVAAREAARVAVATAAVPVAAVAQTVAAREAAQLHLRQTLVAASVWAYRVPPYASGMQ